MKLGKFTKTPVERLRYLLDYSAWLDTGETVLSITMVPSPVTVPPCVVDTISIAGTGLAVNFFVSGGLISTVYTVDVRLTTSVGQVKEDALLFNIQSN